MYQTDWCAYLYQYCNQISQWFIHRVCLHIQKKVEGKEELTRKSILSLNGDFLPNHCISLQLSVASFLFYAFWACASYACLSFWVPHGSRVQYSMLRTFLLIVKRVRKSKAVWRNYFMRIWPLKFLFTLIMKNLLDLNKKSLS